MKKCYLLLFFPFLSFLLPAQVVINEVSSTNHAVIADEDGKYEDWIELYNPGTTLVNLKDYRLVYHDGKPHVWVFPEVFIRPGEHLLVFASEKDRKAVIDHFEVSAYGLDYWRWWTGAEPDTAWRSALFNDSGWPYNRGSFGFGDGDDTTVIPPTMTMYMRKTFTIPDTSKIPLALLLVDYDDAFVAYLNGVEIARDNVGVQGVPPPYGTPAYEEHEAQLYQNGNFSAGFFITKDVLKTAMRNGQNAITMQVHNLDPLSSDMSGLAHFVTGVSDTSLTYFPLPSDLSLHTNFNLASEGFRLSLTNANGDTLDTRIFNALQADHSWGRQTEGNATWKIFQNPTPNDTNAQSIPYDGYAGQPAFNLAPGFYDAPQQLGLSAGGGELIRYTVDGSIPTTSSPVFSTAIGIDSTMVVRARAFPQSSSLLPGLTTTNTYFINEPTNLPVVSISVNPYDLWDYNQGMYVYGPNADPSFPFYGSNFWAGMEKFAHCEFFENREHAFELDNALKIHGNWSKAFPQRSFRVLANDDYGDSWINYRLFPEKNITKYKSFNIRNAGIDWNTTHFRDGLMNRAVRKTNNDIMDHRNCLLFLNGMYWGVYEIREREDERYLEQNFDVDPAKVDFLRFAGNALAGTNTGYIDMLEYVVLQDMSIQPKYDSVKNHLLDVPNVVDYFATEIYYSNRDWLINNIKYWRVNDPPGKWRFVLWDTDGGLGLFSPVTDNLLPYVTNRDTASQYYGNPHSFMMQSLFRNTEFRNYFINRYADLMNTVFHPQNLGGLAQEIHDEIAPEMQRHFAMWGIPNTNPYGFGSALNVPMWENNYGDLQAYIQQRPAYARYYTQQEFNLPLQADVTLDVYPPGAGKIKISTIIPDSLPWTGVYFGGVPVTITAMPNPGYEFSFWDSASFAHDTASSVTINFAGDQALTAYFNALTYTLNAYPNPFNSTVQITYSVPETAQVEIALYDLAGRKLASPVSKTAFTEQGVHTVTVDAQQIGLRPGIYFLVMRAGDTVKSTRIVYTPNTN